MLSISIENIQFNHMENSKNTESADRVVKLPTHKTQQTKP